MCSQSAKDVKENGIVKFSDCAFHLTLSKLIYFRDEKPDVRDETILPRACELGVHLFTCPYSDVRVTRLLLVQPNTA